MERFFQGQSFKVIDEKKQAAAWESDQLQILAYACLIESALGVTVPEGRIRYHADNVLIRVPVDDGGRTLVKEAVEKARSLRSSLHRPPITTNERLCTRCSLAPVCLRYSRSETLAQGVQVVTGLRGTHSIFDVSVLVESKNP